MAVIQKVESLKSMDQKVVVKPHLLLTAIAEVQRAGGYAAFIDAEHALDPQYAKALGVDVDNLILSQPDTGEQALEIAEALIKWCSWDCRH